MLNTQHPFHFSSANDVLEVVNSVWECGGQAECDRASADGDGGGAAAMTDLLLTMYQQSFLWERKATSVAVIYSLFLNFFVDAQPLQAQSREQSPIL